MKNVLLFKTFITSFKKFETFITSFKTLETIIITYFVANMFVFACPIIAKSQCWLFALRANTGQIPVLALTRWSLH